MTNVAPALQGSLCYISYHISIHFAHLEKRSTVGRPLIFYWVLLGSTGFYFLILHRFSDDLGPSANLVNIQSIFVPRGHAAAHISKVNTLRRLLAAPRRQLGQIKCLLFAI